MISVAVGTALQAKLQKQNRVAMNYIGDGGSRVGEFHEAVNFAAVQKLPFILIIENNQFAYSTPTPKQYAAERLIDCAESYGIPGFQIDGTDFFEVYRITKNAVERARRGEGPTLVESVTMRMRGHAEHDNMEYVPKKMLEEWEKKDPIVKFEKYLQDQKLFIGKVREGITLRIKTELEEAIEFAERAPYSSGDDVLQGVFAD
jgi:TPP-dependent pyruvate/acetoin dehydrogenase alpha subunit